ncbi:MAG: hypothetical protein EB120_08760, partial [Proteobacteria bacterium]|nr:hypothetical protein [Pseudomonadota bacterium]
FSFIGALAITSKLAYPVSMNFSGSVRTEADSITNLGQSATKDSKQYIETRALLDPNILIDDHFSIRSQWNLLASPQLTPDASEALGHGQGGWVLGDVRTASLLLNRVWLEWTSDFGVVRVGRVPISWGYGLTWDAGNRPWDQYQTTGDRIEYRLHLGNVVGALAYTKNRKLSVLENTNDQEFYTVFLQYDNPEMDVEGGIYFEKQARSSSQSADFTGNDPANPYNVVGSSIPLSQHAPYPKNNNAIDAYLKKSLGRFTFGGEVTWISGSAYDYAGSGTDDDLSAFAAMANITFDYHKIKAFTEVIYATGDKNLNDDTATSYSLLHFNRARPGLILGKELLGKYHGNQVNQGNLLIYGTDGAFSGLFLVRPGIRLDWSPSWASGVEVIIARKAVTQDGEQANLGWEIDLGTDYNVYKNFDLGVNAGFAFPGDGIPLPTGGEKKMIFALRTTAALRF